MGKGLTSTSSANPRQNLPMPRPVTSNHPCRYCDGTTYELRIIQLPRSESEFWGQMPMVMATCKTCGHSEFFRRHLNDVEDTLKGIPPIQTPE